MAHYRDLLNANGSLNRGVFEIILSKNLTHEINLSLYIASRPRNEGVHVRAASEPKLQYCDVRPWYAAQAAKVDPQLLTERERAEIENEVRTDLMRLVRSMQRTDKIATAEIAVEDAA
jgi:hypothetical protein